jgi:hypothetical protein
MGWRVREEEMEEARWAGMSWSPCWRTQGPLLLRTEQVLASPFAPVSYPARQGKKLRAARTIEGLRRTNKPEKLQLLKVL